MIKSHLNYSTRAGLESEGERKIVRERERESEGEKEKVRERGRKWGREGESIKFQLSIKLMPKIDVR